MSLATFSPSSDVLTKLAAFVLNRETNEFRSELYEYLVMMALSDEKENLGFRKKKIISQIETDLQVENFPSLIINDALLGLEKKGYIKKVNEKEDAIYFLTQDEKTRIELMNKLFSNTLTQVRVTLRKRMGEKGIVLDMNEEAQVFARFRSFLSLSLQSLGKECCASLINSHGQNTISFEPTDVVDDLKQALKSVEDMQMRKIQETVFLEYIKNPDDGLSDLLYSLAQSYFFINILHLDPECQQLTCESLKLKKVYLDTNIVLHAIVSQDKSVDKALKLTHSLGIKTLISKRTKDEFLGLLSRRRQIFGRDPDISSERFEKVKDALEDNLLKDFLSKKKKDPSLTFEMYSDRLKEITAILKNRYGTEEDDNEHKDIYENIAMPSLIESVTLAGKRYGLFKNENVAEHDAFHILLIQEQRKSSEGDILGPVSWFLTHDRSLYMAEKIVEKNLPLPASIYVDNWVQLLSPLIAPKQTKDVKEAYVSLFASRLPIIKGVIDEEIFSKFQGKWMDDEDLSPAEIARVLGNRYIKDYIESNEDFEANKIPEEEKEKIVQSIITEVRSQNKELHSMQDALGHMRKESTEYKSEMEKWKNVSTSQKNALNRLGHVIGGIIFIGVTFGLFELFSKINSVPFWSALLGSMILAAAFGTICDFGGYRRLLDRLLRVDASKDEKQN